MNSRNQDMILGIVFFGALLGLGVITIVLSDFSLGTEWHRAEFFSDDVGYLRPGDPVLLFGMAAGKVEVVERLEEPIVVDRPLDITGDPVEPLKCSVRIVTKLDVDPYEHLKTDYRALIEDRGLLGGKLVRLEMGSRDPLPAGTRLVAHAPPSAIQSASRILEENRAAIQRTIDDIAEITTKANSGEGTLGMLLADDDTQERVSAFIDDFSQVGESLASGEGTLGKLLTDAGPFDDLAEGAANFRGFSDRISRGEGSVGKFIQDDEFYDKTVGVIDDVREAIGPTLEGESTLGKILQSDELHTDAQGLIDELTRLAQDAREGDGTVARLINDPSLYDNVNNLVSDASAVFSDIQEGNGLVAALINDEQILADFRAILGQVLGAIEDARETAPVTSLGSFLFGTF